MIFLSTLLCTAISGYCCTNKFNVLGKLPFFGTNWFKMAHVHTGFTLLNWMAACKLLITNRHWTNELPNDAGNRLVWEGARWPEPRGLSQSRHTNTLINMWCVHTLSSKCRYLGCVPTAFQCSWECSELLHLSCCHLRYQSHHKK